MLNQEAYQRTMALPVGGNNLAAQNQAVFCIVDFEYVGGCLKKRSRWPLPFAACEDTSQKLTQSGVNTAKMPDICCLPRETNSRCTQGICDKKV